MTLIIPAGLWSDAMAVLRRPPHDRERILYLDGPRADAEKSVATTITIPEAHEQNGHFHVGTAEMSRAGRHLRGLGMIRLAQVHSHPAGWTGHSPHDDEMAFSQRDGALSLIVPDYAGTAPGVNDCGIHIRERHGWRELKPAEKPDVIQILPSLIDLRG
jgi:hypothetical protein